MLEFLSYERHLTPIVEELIGRRLKYLNDAWWLEEDYTTNSDNDTIHIRIRAGQLEWSDADDVEYTDAKQCPLVDPVALRHVSPGGCKIICKDLTEWIVLFDEGLGSNLRPNDVYNRQAEKGDPATYLTRMSSYLTLLNRI